MTSFRTHPGVLFRAAQGFIRDRFESVPPLPSGISSDIIGTTLQGRNIEVFRIGHGSLRVLFCGAIHGNEAGTAKLIRFLLSYLAKREDLHPSFTFFFIPVLNVDGYALALRRPDYLHRGRIGRFNSRGVDLNRNFPTASFTTRSVWSHGKGYQETTEVFCGLSPGSEPENEALRSLIFHQGITLLWMFHSVASEIMGSNDPLGRCLAGIFSEATGFHHAREEEWTVLRQTGTAKEWCEENDVVYLESEASERWGSDWERQKKGIEAVVEALRGDASVEGLCRDRFETCLSGN